MRIEVGPISHASAVSWLGYAAESLVDLRRLPDVQLPAKALDTFGELIAGWRAIVEHDDGPFRWHDDLPPERAEFLMRALYEAGLVIERASAARQAHLRPHEADEFHRVLIDCVLTTLEGEAPSSAQFAEAMRAEWEIARHP